MDSMSCPLTIGAANNDAMTPAPPKAGQGQSEVPEGGTEGDKPRRRNLVVRALDGFYAVLDLGGRDRSPGRQWASLGLLLVSVLGVPWACVTAVEQGRGDLALLFFVPAWIISLLLGAVGYGLRCPSCRKWWSRKTARYDEKEGPLVTEKLPNYQVPGTLDIVRRRSVSWRGDYRCKRCGHAWSKQGTSERKY